MIDRWSTTFSKKYGLETNYEDKFRLYERTFSRTESISHQFLIELNSLVAYENLEVIASSIHIHLRPAGWTKADGVKKAIRLLSADQNVRDEEVIVIGDSRNDASLFRDFSELSVGVATLLAAEEELGADLPRFITKYKEAKGFSELALRIINARTQSILGESDW